MNTKQRLTQLEKERGEQQRKCKIVTELPKNLDPDTFYIHIRAPKLDENGMAIPD